MRWWGRCNIQIFLDQECWVSCHTMQNEVRGCLMQYLVWIYRIVLMFMMHNTIFFMLINVKKTLSKCFVNDSVVSFIIYIDPWGITTSIFHWYAEVIGYKVGNIHWVLQGAVIFNSHMSAWMLFIIQCY